MLAAGHSLNGTSPNGNGIPPTPAVTPPSLTSSLWSRAIAELNEKDQRMFALTTNNSSNPSTTTPGILNDILISVQAQRDRCQHNRWRTKSLFTGQEIIVRDVCAKIAACVRRFIGVVDVAVSSNPGHAALPWAGVRFVMQLCINSFEVFDALVEGLERVASVIARCSIVESLYLDHQQGRGSEELRAGLESALGKLYSAVLGFLCRARRYYHSSLMKKVANLTTKQSLQEAVQTIGDAENRFLLHKEFIDGERINSINDRSLETNLIMTSVQADKSKLKEALKQLEKPVFRAADHVSELYNALKDTQRAALLKWLSPILVQEHYRSALMGLVPGSGEWLLNGTLFVTWRDSSASESFWLHGIPGCGKSKIAAAVLQHLHAQGNNMNYPAPIAHFFCSRDSQEPEKSDARHILMSLAKQISITRHNEGIRQPTVDVYQQRRLRSDHDGESPATLTADECVDLICDLGRTTPMTIVIDAVDECTAQNQEILLSALDEIQETSRDVVKIFVTSRHVETVAAHLQHGKTVELTEEASCEDLKRFVSEGVDQFLKKWSYIHEETKDTLECLRVTISQELMRKAKGMFLWVSLQLDTISDFDRIKRPDDIVNALGSPPSSLSDSYTAILKRIESQGEASRTLAKSAFRWLLCAKRPLTCDEFTATVGSPPRLGGGPAPDRPSAESIVACCCNLVTIEDISSERRFRLVHSTVRSHLESLDEYRYESNHCHVGRRCLETYSTLWDDFQEDGLLPYSTQYWPAHVEIVQKGSDSVALSDLLADFFTQEEHFEDWLKTLEELPAEDSPRWSNPLERKLGGCFSSPPSPLFAICCFGLLRTLRNPEIGGSLDLEQKNKDGTSGLYIAARWGHTDLVRELLDRGVDPNAPGRQYGNAIQAAAFAGHADIVKLLLEKGAQTSSEGGEYSSPLQAALANGQESAATVLLDFGFQYINHRQYNDALDVASFNGQVSIVQKLLEVRPVDSAVQDASRPNPLQVALYSGKARKAREFLRSCTDINAQKGYFGNALSAAIAGKKLVLVKEVVAAGARLDQRGRFGYPLRAAALTNRVDVVKYLLEIGREYGAGVDPNATDSELGDALQAAASRGDCGVMLLLLSHGADVDGNGGFFGNTLQAASFGGHEQAVRLLLEHGAKLDDSKWGSRSTGRYRDAVQAAVYGGHEHVVALLLEKGAQLNSIRRPRCLSMSCSHRAERGALPAEHDGTGQSDIPDEVGPLEVAARCGIVGMIRMLIARGVKIDAPDVDRQYQKSGMACGCAFTALQITAFWGHAEAAMCLLDAGADVNAVRHTMGTPLQAALEGSRLDVAELLLKRGAGIDKHWMEFGSCLQVYAERGNLEMVKFLHEMGANLNDKGGENGTALQVACDAGRLGVVTYLLENGAEINVSGGLNGPALQAAAASGHVEIAQLLLDRGAQIEGNEDEIGSPLQDAAASGHEEVVRILLQRGARVDSGVKEEESNTDDDNGLSHHDNIKTPGPPLHLATWYGHEEIVRMLLEFGADVHAEHRTRALVTYGSRTDFEHRGKRGTALSVACARGHNAIAGRLFSRDPTGYISRGSLVSALKVSLDCEKDELAVMLVREGMDAGLQHEHLESLVDLASQMGRTTFLEQVSESYPHGNWTRALHKAATEGRSEVVQQLLKRSVDVDGKNENGRTVLELAWNAFERLRIYPQPKWIETIAILADAGANMAALHGEVHHVAIAASKDGKIGILEAFERQGFELFTDAEHHSTALSKAAECHHVALVKLLCRCRVPTPAAIERAIASANHRERRNYRALLEVVQALMDVKIPFEINEDGAFQKAAEKGHTDIIKLLLQYARPTPRIAVIKTALKGAIRSRQPECFKALLETLDETPVEKRRLCTSAAMDEMPRLRDKMLVYLLSEGLDPNMRSSNRDEPQTLLYYTAETGNIETLMVLLAHGADVNLASAGPHGTALHAAAVRELPYAVELLLDAGADPNSRNDSNDTPLSVTMAGGWGFCRSFLRKCSSRTSTDYIRCAECCAKALLDHGADVDAVVAEPLGTMLAIATVAGDSTAVKFLLERGADPDINTTGVQAYKSAREAARKASTMMSEERRREWREKIIEKRSQKTGKDQDISKDSSKEERRCGHIVCM